MAEDGVEPESDEASGGAAAPRQASPTRRSPSLAHQAVEVVHAALSVVLRAVGLKPTRPGLYLYSKEYCKGTEHRIYREYVGDVVDECGFEPCSAYAYGETHMWDVTWPKETGVVIAAASTLPGTKTTYNTLSFKVLAGEHV